MTDADIERWKPLRTRVLMGEALSASEQRFYEETLDELDRTETFPGTHDKVEALMAEVAKLRKEAQDLRQIEASLDAEIERLESAYRKATGKSLLSAA